MRLPSLAGPLIAAVGAWCALGEISVPDADRALPRVAAPAPWWALALLLVVAAAVPGWRRRPVLALPALFAILPWLPVPLPAVALIWTGPLAWLPVAIALGAAVGPAFGARLGKVLDGLSPARSTVVAGVLSLACGAYVAWAIAPQVPQGDEPQYLVITQSLIADGDLQVENNHRNRDYLAYFPMDIQPNYRRRGENGEIYSIHAPGVSVLVLPAFAVFGYRGAQFTILALAALAGALMWHAAWLAIRDRRAAWFGWAAVSTSLTFLFQGVTIFPDGPAACVVAGALWLFIRLRREPDRVGGATLVAAGGLLGALPWLHTRFSILAAGLGLAVVSALATDPARPVGSRIGRAAGFLALPVVAAAGWFAFFRVLYGTFNPAAPYASEAAALDPAFVPGGLVGLLVDQQFGLIAWSPVLAAGLAGVWIARANPDRRWALPMAGVAFAYLLMATSYWMWWVGGPAPPARLAAAVLPVLAPLAALAWRRADAPLRAVWAALLVLSATATAVLVTVARGDIAWNVRSEETRWLEWLGPLVNLPRALPSFFWALDPENLRTEASFFGHAALTLLVAIVGVRLFVRFARRYDWQSGRRTTALALWAPIVLMVVSWSGWALDGIEPLDPARSQLDVLSRWRAGGTLVAIDAGAVRVLRSEPRFVVRAEAPAVRDGPPQAYLQGIPSGDYEVWVDVPRPVDGTIGVRVGRSPEYVRAFDAGRRSPEAFRLPLPAGAVGVGLEMDEGLRMAGARVSLVPVAPGNDGHVRARLALRYGRTDAYFLDPAAYPEPSGFWVRGGDSAEVWLMPPAGQGGITLDLRNVDVRNRVELTGAVAESFDLLPGERRSVPLPADRGVVRVRIRTSEGIVPRDVSDSADGRYLGVWVEVR